MLTEKRMYRGREIEVRFVSREELAPCWGMAHGRKKGTPPYIRVREDLLPRVQRFVITHELYHIVDEHKWWGVLGREIRANIVPALTDPIGAMYCLFANLNRERIRFYIDRFRNRY